MVALWRNFLSFSSSSLRISPSTVSRFQLGAMCAIGTKRTNTIAAAMSAFGGKADTPCNGAADAFVRTRPDWPDTQHGSGRETWVSSMLSRRPLEERDQFSAAPVCGVTLVIGVGIYGLGGPAPATRDGPWNSWLLQGSARRT